MLYTANSVAIVANEPATAAQSEEFDLGEVQRNIRRLEFNPLKSSK